MALSKDFFLCGWNIFDLIIVTASLLDIIFELVDGLSVLRGLRLLRVLKLAQSWTTMKVLLSIIISTIGALGNLTLILVIVIYIFAVIGMQLFSKDYTPEKFDPDPVPRWNFNDFFHSFMMIFRILCGEWIEPLWDCMRAEEEQGASSCFAIFLPTLVMGNFMVLNLFLALLLNSFNSEELKSKKEEVGEESKLARSIERVRDLIRKKRQERKERKERKYATKFQQIVIEAQQAAAQVIEKPSLTTETKLHRLSYQESMNRPVSGSDFGFQIPLKDTLHTIVDGVECEHELPEKQHLQQQHLQSPTQLQQQQQQQQLHHMQLQQQAPSFDGITTTTSSCQLDNNSRNDYNTLYPQAERRLLHQVSSGFGTQHNDSRDEPTYTESIELRLMGQYNSTDTDPYANDQRSGSFMRGDSLQDTLSRRFCNDEHDEAYLQYQKSLLTRSPSYRKSLDRLSQSSDQSQRSLIASRSLKSEDDLHLSARRHSSGQSLNTISIEHEELLSHHGNLRDDLLNCEHKELFQFLQDDADNSNNYFSETVGYGSAIVDPDTDSLIVDGRKDERKPSTSSIKSNLSYISNSIMQQIELRRNGSHASSNGNGHGNESLPLVEHSEFDNIIQSFEKELEEIKRSTTSLERRLSTLSEPSPAADEANKAILDHIAVITGASARSAADEVVHPLNPYDSYDLSTVPRRQHPLLSSTDRNSVKIKRRSLEKQRKIDEDFSISNEIRKICDQIHAPFVTIESMAVAATVTAAAKSPFSRHKSDQFAAQFDRFKRLSLIERVDEVPEEEKPISTLRMESEKLPRKCLTTDAIRLDSLSLKSTNSYENLLIQKQQLSRQHSNPRDTGSIPPTPPTSLKSKLEPPTLAQISSIKTTPPLAALTEHQQHYHASKIHDPPPSSLLPLQQPLLSSATKNTISTSISTATTSTSTIRPKAAGDVVSMRAKRFAEHPQSTLDKAASFQSTRTESHSSCGGGIADTSSVLALGTRTSASGAMVTETAEPTQQKSAFSRLTEKPWHCLVSYVDDLTVGGRRNSQGAYNDPMTFPSFGQTKTPKVPDDCFPQKCYDQ
ncbi:unnamed protein product [Ceratitis capitata]|uniref:(Mediterranean fruit fly) hypothetical protein n=1 Tax=Ceratitis capitata TaxID=7213 RepID=A0A811VKZ6_CERCA|nr:unnamed protein product [Ceratitis capitata]